MDIEKAKDKKVNLPKYKHNEFTGERIVAYLLKAFNFERAQTLAELLNVDARTLSNWTKKSYDELNKQSGRLRALYDAIFAFEQAHIPPSAYLRLLKGELVDGGRRTLL